MLSRNHVEDTFVFSSHTTNNEVDSKGHKNAEIRLMMLSCEDCAPYGPSNHTAVSEEFKEDRINKSLI